jgi:hypothetical protein
MKIAKWSVATPLGLVIIALLFASASAWGQIKVSTIVDASVESSQMVMTDLRSKLAAHPKQFTLVNAKDSEAGLLVMVSCFQRNQKADPFVCFYTGHYAGGTSKTLLGAGIQVATTSSEVADNLLASIAQDIAESWNTTMRANAIESLDACLFLTQSSCKVPDELQPELKTKIINLSQYLQRGALKK